MVPSFERGKRIVSNLRIVSRAKIGLDFFDPVIDHLISCR